MATAHFARFAVSPNKIWNQLFPGWDIWKSGMISNILWPTQYGGNRGGSVLSLGFELLELCYCHGGQMDKRPLAQLPLQFQ